MKMIVTRDPNNDTEWIELDFEDVVAIQSWDRTVILHTAEEQFYPVLPILSNMEKVMERFGFRKLDRTNLVNVNKIKHYDFEQALVFFEAPVTNKSKYATISYRENSKLKHEIQRWIEQNVSKPDEPR
ncbi:LytTR family transcriptional regulator DNA-binding domain-containing protein [Paenibacillus flagellatus]|uniref:LytR family transcriptional regulator n=1 Tax=Paenibacillus flagellatus TaxID=2211139 RepID=A0A2V5KCR4_9BACL|nr:LytTR family transcriptional regulator DNA-binding domain-containing protein [Paenibacillus flagellatus]PYI57328.1 LytR family transcriptional regulator [Paenibacillus flagellatus]